MEVGAIIEQSAARFGDRVAVVLQSRSVAESRTFTELDTESNRLASGFLAEGVTPGDAVGLLSNNSIEFVETYFAIQKIGARVVPINVRYDQADVEHVLDIAEPTCLVGEADLLAEFEAPITSNGVEVFSVEQDSGHRSLNDLQSSSTTSPDVDIGGDTVDSYFFTSGSTGRPKGVVHTHNDRIFVNLNIISEFGVRHDDVNLTPLPLYHSGPLYTGLMPFIQFGVPTVLFREFDPSLVLEGIEQHEATILGGVPAQFNQIVAAAEAGKYDASSLRFWWYSGAPMSAELRERCWEQLCNVHSVVYGATEIGPPVSTLPPEDGQDRPDSCGTGHMGQRIRVISIEAGGDPTATVEAGESGELIVKGESVMDRYLAIPERTEEALVDGWYFTGDVGRRDEDGYLYVEGRKDEMIISGGENIYPSEIESVLIEHPEIEDVAVVGVPHDDWGETPKAFIVKSGSGALNADAIDEYCRESRLADYKRPREVTFVSAIPRNEGGGSVLTEELLSLDTED